MIVYGLIGILVGRLYDRLPWKNYLGKALQSFVIAYVLLLIITSVLLALTEASAGPVSLNDLILYLILPNIAFGFVLPGLYQKISLHWPTVSNLAHKKQVGTDMSGGVKPKDY